MKSFKQFLNECYLSEEPTGRPAKKRKPGGPTVDEVKAKQNAEAEARAARKAQRGPTGAAADPTKQFKPQGKTSTVPGSTFKPSTETSSAAKEAEKAAAKTATKTAGKGVLKTLGKIAGPASAALDVADELGNGSGPLRALTKGAVVAAGGALGGTAGSVAGPVGTVGGAVGGSMAASKAFDTVAGANAKERKAMATANRQRQAGSSIKGIGGKTTFDTKKNTITSAGKTAQLGKTSVVTGPGGKQEVGHLAYKGGKAVYKRAAAPGSDDGILAKIRRVVDPSGAKKSDAANAAKKLATARQSDTARNKALGVKMLPGK